MAKKETIQGLFTLVTSRNKNSKTIEKGKPKITSKPRGSKASNKRSPKGEPMSNPLSYPRHFGYTY
jgi:hypothetical protein